MVFVGKVVEVVQETPHVRKIVFELDSVLEFVPGQFVMVVQTHEKDGQEHVVKRAYSICSYVDNKMSVVLNEVAHGTVSPVVYNLEVGDTVDFEGPKGLFCLEENDTKKVFMAGGTGIAPIFSMLLELENRDKLDDSLLFYSVKTKDDIIFKNTLEGLREKGCKVVICLTGETVEDWKGESKRIDGEMLERYVGDLEEYEFYLCGPSEMIKDLVLLLPHMGVEKENIHHERW